VEDVVFELNFVRDLTDYALKFDGASEIRVLSNTFRDAASDGLRIEGAGVAGGEIRNNLWLRTGALDAGTFNADHNGYFETGSVGFVSATDVAADPLLVDGYRLGDGSPMIDAGVDVGHPFAGDAPDIGAFEAGTRRSACEDVEPPLGSGGGGGGDGGQSHEGAGGNAGGGGSGGSDADQSDAESGCACHVSSSSNTPLAAVALAAILMARSRRRRT
jgi:MYXO-CTERM domain-containing protein